MMSRSPLLFLFLALLFAPFAAWSSEGGEGGGEGGEKAQPVGIGYYTLDPEFITNYQTEGPVLGYVRVKVDLMVDNAGDIALLKKHEPLLRDTIVSLLGNQVLEQVRSQQGRETLRDSCKKAVIALLTKEEGRPVIRDLLFTNYLYQ